MDLQFSLKLSCRFLLPSCFVLRRVSMPVESDVAANISWSTSSIGAVALAISEMSTSTGSNGQGGAVLGATYFGQQLFLLWPRPTLATTYFGHDRLLPRSHRLWPRSVFGIFEAEEEMGGRGRSGGSKGGGVEGWEDPNPEKGWGPEGWEAQNYAFFPLPAPIFVSFFLSGSLLVEFWWCFSIISVCVSEEHVDFDPAACLTTDALDREAPTENELHGGGHWNQVDGHTGSCALQGAKVGELYGARRAEHLPSQPIQMRRW